MKKDKQFSIRISTQDLETIRGKAAQAHTGIGGIQQIGKIAVPCCDAGLIAPEHGADGFGTELRLTLYALLELCPV